MPTENNSICFVIPKFVTFSTGGAELQVHLLSQQFLKNGWSVEIICRGKGLEHIIEKSPYNDKRIRYQYYKRTSFFSADFFKVFRLLTKTKSRWIYNRTDDAATAAVALFARLTGRKSVYALASDDDATLLKYSNQYKKIEYSSKLKQLLRLTDISILDKLTQWGKRNTSLIFCQTATQQQLFEYNFKRKSELVSNSAVNTIPERVEKENIILWVGNFRGVKQPQLFVKLAKDLKAYSNWQFIMIGEADEASLPMLNEMNSQSNFKYMGSLSYDITAQWFAKAKIYLNTSSVEGFPNTFIQAWLNHCHIVSLNANPDNLLDNPVMGKVFNGNYNELKEYVLQFINNTVHINGSAQMAYIYAFNQFNIDINTNKIIKILSKESAS